MYRMAANIEVVSLNQLAALIRAGWELQLHQFDEGWCLLAIDGSEIRHLGMAGERTFYNSANEAVEELRRIAQQTGEPEWTCPTLNCTLVFE